MSLAVRTMFQDLTMWAVQPSCSILHLVSIGAFHEQNEDTF